MTCSGVSTWGRLASAPGIGLRVTPLRPSPAQCEPGRHDHDLGAVFEHVLGGERRVQADRDVLEPVELHPPVVDHVTPAAEAGEAGDPAHRPADVIARVDHVHQLHAALAEHDGALHARPVRRRPRARRGRRSWRA